MGERADIGEALSRYCWALDQQDWAALGDLFTEDATWTPNDGRSISGAASIVANLRALAVPGREQMHMLSSLVSEIGEDQAELKAYAMILRTPSNDIAASGRYRLTLVRIAECWKIASLAFRRADAAGPPRTPD